MGGAKKSAEVNIATGQYRTMWSVEHKVRMPPTVNHTIHSTRPVPGKCSYMCVHAKLMGISWNTIPQSTPQRHLQSSLFIPANHTIASTMHCSVHKKQLILMLSWEPHLVSTGVEEVLQPDDVRVVESSHDL